MDKRHLHHAWTKFRDFKLRYIVAIFLLSTVMATFGLRQNNLHMVDLKKAVYAADQNGGDTEKALQNLQVYVTAHMNTQLSTGPDAVYPPIQLKYTYERLVKAESDKLAQSNERLYNDAQAYCEAQNSADFSGRNRVPCIQQYVKDHGAPLRNIPDSLYKFDFVSPVWSPDFAGWSILVAAVNALAIVVLVVLRWWFKREAR